MRLGPISQCNYRTSSTRKGLGWITLCIPSALIAQQDARVQRAPSRQMLATGRGLPSPSRALVGLQIKPYYHSAESGTLSPLGEESLQNAIFLL